MIIRWVFGRRLGSKEGFSCLRTGEHGRWSFIALALCLLAGSLPAQIAPGSAASQAIGSPNTSSAARPAFPPGGGASAPAGYVLGPNDYVGGRSFRRRRFAHKWTIESRRQLKCAIAGLSPFSGFNADPGGFETHGALRLAIIW